MPPPGRLRALSLKSSVEVFCVLVRLFFSRFFGAESLSRRGDPETNIVQALGILAVPGAFVTFFLILLPIGKTGWDLVSMRFLFVSFSMAIGGLLVVLKWDALFPDRRDYQILLPLPLPSWMLLAASVSALALFLGLFLFDVNFFATLFWPGIEQGNYFAIAGTHLTVVSAAGIFSALVILSCQGLLLTTVPARIFRPAATFVQTILMAALVMLLFLLPALTGSVRELLDQHGPLMRYVPAFWFSGLYERLRPAVPRGALSNPGQVAVPALGCALAAFLLTHLPGYRRHARKLIETVPADPAGPGRLRVAISGALDRLLLRNPVQQAVFHFIGMTIGRSIKHRLFLATYAGFGAALVIVSRGTDREGLLGIPLTLSFILVSGLRAAFNFPAELGANWAFQIGVTDGARDCPVATRKWIAVCGIAPLLLLLAPLELAFFSPAAVLFQTLYCLTLSLLLVEAMFAGFRKIPFTCAYFPGKINLVLLLVMYVFGFSLYSGTFASLETWLMKTPRAAAEFFGGAACLLLLAWRAQALRGESEVDYFDDEPLIRTLDLKAQ